MGSPAQRKTIVCPCQDVTLGDILDAVEHGHTNVETVKRATAVFMGACQGKTCAPHVEALLSERGGSEQEYRRPSARLPVQPVLLGMLADPGEN
ncbi:(2Fe-2S)-binding protein [Herbiconiux sp. KACC 21604]|uniref:(2Fe-2S)-binding protein n=1 Tax=unclassified Herbiconiux TaxID=2618217 RepID=UPI001490AFB1|nr:(2Fe-2S)-binding protein [Herbiconiux sp. SALV-R1]QJU55675.1 (2Fe-2S)-binding protein [Herbiconiux sp. SALV-R1]WPO86878.1 (2Fe-2S)-binding protein [Herbiconiux sp. KACC 21604]